MDPAIAPYACANPPPKSALRDSARAMAITNTSSPFDHLPLPTRPGLKVRFRSTNSIVAHPDDLRQERESDWEDVEDELDTKSLHTTKTFNFSDRRYAPYDSSLHTIILVAIVMAVSIALSYGPWTSASSRLSLLSGAAASELSFEGRSMDAKNLFTRDNSPTDACMRFSGQSAIVNGTLYYYGGQVLSSAGQTDNTWTTNFITLNLHKNWQISSPALSGLTQPSGPPAVSNGYLWSSFDQLYLYGGIFSWKPETTPTQPSLWQYDIASAKWSQQTSLTAAGGANAVPSGSAINRAGEGAGANFAATGKGWYFGGHLDHYTTPGWSVQVPRQYLSSLLEYTYPGYPTVDGKIAGANGEWRNITTGGIQGQAGFTPRADGLILYVPGFGDQGVLVSIGGGVNTTFTQMNEIDVFDIASSTWYKQSTSGTFPQYRVNPCAVVVAAADGSSYNVHMFAGQNLQPFGDQTQYNDMWILSIPSFIWIQVNQTGQSVPPGRSGHTCNVWDGQMVVVGGYPGAALTCESPGIYVFDLSTLSWQNSYVARSATKKKRAIAAGANPFSQQLSQIGDNSTSGLQGSYGYAVPPAVYNVIGGSATGGATITAPVATATAGPLATGHAQTYTVTGADGSITTSTSVPASNGATRTTGNGPNVGAIVAGVIAGILFIIALYLGFCALVYRRQVKLYKEHIAMSQRSSNGEKIDDFTAPSGFQVLRPTRHSRGSSWRNSDTGGSVIGGAGAVGSTGSPAHNKHDSYSGLLAGTSYHSGYTRPTSGEMADDDDDLLWGMEPTFVGVLLHPRRSLRVVNTPN